jgi:DNA-directed RNA polymerase subunit RPC12/RpoP
MMNDKTILYRTFYNPIEANIVKARLDDSGFACFLADENLATLNPLYNQAIGGVRLIVFERDVDAIDTLLAEDILLPDADVNDEVNAEGVACENCGSTNVSYGMATKQKFSWWVTILSFIFFTYPFKANKCYHCYNCGEEFN